MAKKRTYNVTMLKILDWIKCYLLGGSYNSFGFVWFWLWLFL